MSIRHITIEDISKVNKMWNVSSYDGDFLYKKLDETQFFKKFYQSTSDYTIVTIVFFDEEQLKGFASGVYEFGRDTAYITTVVVKKRYRNQGIGKELITSLENELKDLSSNIIKFDIIFLNPIHLEWIVPGTSSHDHPNAPGVDMSSFAYTFFKKCGYKEFAIQNSYYRDIRTYQFSDKTSSNIKKLEDSNIKIVYYDKKKHLGFDELFDDLNSESWRKEILEVSRQEQDGDPILVVDIDGKIHGFTGPLRVQESLRGYFAGIGIHSNCRGFGVGGVLFSALCKGLKNQGAEYMTLFTGEGNPARNIYEKEGFKIIKSWSNMRKELL